MTGTGTLTALEIAKIACDIETDGMNFYRAAADVAPSAKNKGLFRDLGQQEFEHLGRFRELYKQLDERMGGSESTTEYLFDDELTRYLKVISQGMVFPEGDNASTWLAKGPDIKDILKFALQAEKDSILLYTEIIDNTVFADSKEMLQKIIAEERSHLVRLSTQLVQAK